MAGSHITEQHTFKLRGSVQPELLNMTLPVLRVNKNYRRINDVLCNWTDLDEAAFLPQYPNPVQWSNTYYVEIKTVNPNANPVQGTDERLPIIVLE